MRLGCHAFRQQLSRRNFLQIGGVGLFGLTLPQMFRAQALAAERAAKAKQVIFLFLQGGPPHQDMFDLKPDQPAEIRSPFKPIHTVVPGLDVCEHLPKLAQVADKYTILRSVTSRGYPHAGDHHAGVSWKTGNPRALRGTPKYPMYGSVLAKLQPGLPDVPSFVAMGDVANNAPGLRENYLGPAYDPLYVNVPGQEKRREDENDPLTQMLVPPELNVSDFERNVDLVRALDQQSRQLDAASPLIAGMDRFQQKAFDLLRSPKLREALAVDKEPAENLGRYAAKLEGYGKKNYTRRVLAARRMIEAGVPFVYVDLPYWDWHGGVKASENAGMSSLAGFDAAVSSLLVDLDERGLLDSTIVMALGEMGRTPKMNKNGPAARDHWAPAQFVLVAGGGFQPGRIVGATDAQAAYVKDAEYKVASLGKTMYHLLGIDPDLELYTTDNRPLKLITEDVPLIREAI